MSDVAKKAIYDKACDSRILLAMETQSKALYLEFSVGGDRHLYKVYCMNRGNQEAFTFHELHPAVQHYLMV